MSAMTKFDGIYQKMLRDIMESGIEEYSDRTKLHTKALPGMHFQINPAQDGFPLLTLRKVPIVGPIAEQIWFLSGSRKPEEFLRDFTKVWDAFTNPNDVVTVAYGYRWRKHFGRDQISKLIELLESEPSSRHGVVIAWDPAQDGLSTTKKKNVPCPYTFTVNIIGGALQFHNIIRSNDMILGFPFDVAGFCFLQYVLAQRLGVKVGAYSHSISNAHIYENHYQGTEELMKRGNDHPPIKLNLPRDTFARAEKKDSSLITEIVEKLKKQYNPLPKIEGLKIAL
jgi:thymidylate synthase